MIGYYICQKYELYNMSSKVKIFVNDIMTVKLQNNSDKATQITIQYSNDVTWGLIL